MDSKEVAIGVFLDIRRAFDTVWHQGLVSKLYSFNINPNLVRLINSFLHNRSFVVSVGDELSRARSLRSGVPQGAVLSPVLYTLFTADFPKAIQTSNYYYADDIAFLSTSRSENLAHYRVQQSLNLAEDFFKKWKLQSHPTKSQSIIFTNKIRLKKLPLYLKGEQIPYLNTIKYLGVLMDKKLSWSSHLKVATKKAHKP